MYITQVGGSNLAELTCFSFHNLIHVYFIHIQGAKLFYLSGLIHGQYPKTEVHNLVRFISVVKLPPLEWRGSHPYLRTDRMEDLTDPEERRQNVKCDRTVSLTLLYTYQVICGHVWIIYCHFAYSHISLFYSLCMSMPSVATCYMCKHGLINFVD